MESQRENLGNPQEQKAKDIDRLVNEGGHDIVSARELARREELWKQMHGEIGGKFQMTLFIEQGAAELLTQMAKQRGLSLSVHAGLILDAYCRGEMIERLNVQ